MEDDQERRRPCHLMLLLHNGKLPPTHTVPYLLYTPVDSSSSSSSFVPIKGWRHTPFKTSQLALNGRRSNVHSGPFHNNCYTGLYQLQHTHMYSLALLLLGRARRELKCYTNCSPTAIQSAVTATARRRHCLLAQQHRAEIERHWEQDGGGEGTSTKQ